MSAKATAGLLAQLLSRAGDSASEPSERANDSADRPSGSLRESWAQRLTPEPFRDFLPYTSLSALDVIHTGQVLKRALQIAQHYGSESARSRAAAELRDSLAKSGLPIAVSRAPIPVSNLQSLEAPLRAEIGAQILKLYFHQLYATGPWFLDLRPRHFSWDEVTRTLNFFPSSLWYEPDADFRRRVQQLYEGFYRDEREALSAGIELYGWRSQPSAGFPSRIERLLREHFGSGRAGAMVFSIAHFRETFDRIFQEAAGSRAKLHPELTFLGVGLVGLYLSLERLAVPLEPSQAFHACANAAQGAPGR